MNMKLEDLIGENYYSIVEEETKRYGANSDDDKFIMLPIVDFVFKQLFGDPKRTERLKSLLKGILKLSDDDLEDIAIINSELPRDFADDKYGILDIRAMLRDGRQIDIEIQILHFSLMPERTLYYWAKMYSQQIKKGEDHRTLKKCITINILSYNFPLADKVHSLYHIVEDGTRMPLTDVLEIHFIDLEKLRNGMGIDGIDPPLLKWLRFLAARSKGEFEMLARKDKEISEAYLRLKELSADDKQRMQYEAREAWLMDQRTREALAKEEGIAKGIAEEKRETAIKALQEGIEITLIEKITGLSSSEIEKILIK
jgi:predicted transposase/invertase (TIGR01784 family)